MPELRIDIDEALALAAELQQLAEGLALGLEAATRAAAAETLAQARHAILTGPRSGRVYRSHGRVHRASAPGEPPASVSGRLAASLEAVDDGEALLVASEVDYALYLERGTATMAPRPFLGPAAEASEADFAAAIEAAVDAAIDAGLADR